MNDVLYLIVYNALNNARGSYKLDAMNFKFFHLNFLCFHVFFSEDFLFCIWLEIFYSSTGKVNIFGIISN